MRNRNAVAGFVVCAALVLAVQTYFASIKVLAVDPDDYARGSVDIEVRNGWRFGFFPGMHGTLLVKTPDHGQSARLPSSDYLRELHGVMSRELRQIPLRAVLESALYLAVLAFVFFVAVRLRRVVLGSSPARSRRFAGNLLPGAIVFCLASAPLLLFGYGYGGFTNLVGPGAMSYSGPYFHWQSWLHDSSNSISYRAVVSPLMLGPRVLIELSWLAVRKIPIYGPLLDDEPFGTSAYWIAGTLLYGAVGALLIRGLAYARRVSDSI